MFRAADRQILNVIVTLLALVPFLQLKFRTSQFLGSICCIHFNHLRGSSDLTFYIAVIGILRILNYAGIDRPGRPVGNVERVSVKVVMTRNC